MRVRAGNRIYKSMDMRGTAQSLLHHLPSYYHDLHRAIELASNIQHWNEIFDQNVDFISLKTCFDHGIFSTIL